jgi:hypothetical protein
MLSNASTANPYDDHLIAVRWPRVARRASDTVAMRHVLAKALGAGNVYPQSSNWLHSTKGY